MDIYTSLVVLSVVIFVGIGTWSGRGVRELDDYYVAGRRAPTLLIVGSLVASVFSTSIFLGEAGFTYAGQLGPYMLMPGIAVAGYIYGALLFGTFLRRSRAPTVADFLGQRFNSRRVQQAAGITIILGLGGYLLVVTQGAAILLADLFGISYATALILTWLSYTLFTLYAGSRGVVITDTLMFLLFTAATILFVSYITDDFGGVRAAVSQLAVFDSKPGIASWHGVVGPGTDWPTPMDYLIWTVIVDSAWGVVYAVSPWQASRHLMARNEHVVLRSAIYACFAVILMQILIYGGGGLINLANPDISPVETVMLWAAKHLVPDILGAMLVAGIVAAALSSASTFLSLVGFSVSNDVSPHRSELSLGGTRLAMLATGLAALLASFFVPPNVFWLMLFIGTVFASSWGPVAFMSVWSSRITANGAFWGITVGFIGNVIPAALEYFGWVVWPVLLPPVVTGTLLSLAAIFFCAQRETPSVQERSFREKLHITPLADRDADKLRITLIAPACLILYGCVMPVVMLSLYVFPYQASRGELGPDGGINWATGEAIATLGAPLIYIPLGIIAMRVIRRRYQPPGHAAPTAASAAGQEQELPQHG
ncbi:MAG: sodium:solute symporter family protein [Halieaceae bacterium]|nr:sodium:solute symporter family protein [Halieaceae bacterium]